MFERLYASPIQDPLFFWLAAAIFLTVLVARMPFLTGFLVWFTFELCADALFTGALTPIPKDAAYGAPVGVACVILGDLRYFLLVERFARREASAVSALGRALAWAFVVPVIAFALRTAIPSLASPARVTFLTYELTFLALAIVLRAVLWPPRLKQASPEIRRWLLGLTGFEIVQYALWASADVILLAGHDIGYLVRLVPNAMYYVAFLPFVWAMAPRDLRASRPAATPA